MPRRPRSASCGSWSRSENSTSRCGPWRKVNITFVDPETATDVDYDTKPGQQNDSGNENDTSDEQTALHGAILANLERMQTDLVKLLTLWRARHLLNPRLKTHPGIITGLARTSSRHATP